MCVKCECWNLFVEICVLKLYLKYVSIETATEMCVSKLYLKYVSVKTVIKDMCVETVLEIICVETLFQTLKKIQKKTHTHNAFLSS